MAAFSVDQRDHTRAITFCVFAAPETEIDWRDASAQKALIKRVYAGMSWHVPEIMSTLDAADDLYFDAISRVDLPRYSEGRVALLGDAAWGVTFGGVGPAIVGAYVLAGELAAAGGSHTRAFSAYEQRMRRHAAALRKHANPGAFLAPRTARGLWFRNTLLAMRPVQWLMLRTQNFVTYTDLPSYGQRA